MSQPLRLEEPDKIQHITSRCLHSKLWFVNNPLLRQRIYAFLAMYAQKYSAKIYNFEVVGNHHHLLARFPKANTADFMRDLNARIAEAVRFYVPNYPGGPLFESEYATQYLGDDEAHIKYFFYTMLQCVSSKLSKYLKQYTQEILGFDAINGVTRTYKYFNFTDYNRARRSNPDVSKDDFWESYELEFERLPGHEFLSQEDYVEKMNSLLRKHYRELIQKHEEAGVVYLGAKRLRQILPGSVPKNTKKGNRRPRVLALCMEARQQCLEYYYSCVDKYIEASKAYRAGDFTTAFPPGMYRPPGHTIKV